MFQDSEECQYKHISNIEMQRHYYDMVTGGSVLALAHSHLRVSKKNASRLCAKSHNFIGQYFRPRCICMSLMQQF